MNTTETPAAPVPTPAAKTAKPRNARAMEIIQGAIALGQILEKEKVTLDGFLYRTTKIAGMHVVRVPSFKEASRKLPDSDGAKAAFGIIRGMAEGIEKLAGTKSKATWVIRETGSCNVMGLTLG